MVDPRAERERLVHALAELWTIVSVNLPALRDQVSTDEGRAAVDDVEEAIRRAVPLFERLRKAI